jgi:hypothetical protein
MSRQKKWKCTRVYQNVQFSFFWKRICVAKITAVIPLVLLHRASKVLNRIVSLMTPSLPSVSTECIRWILGY